MSQTAAIRAGMVGLGMIFDETYRPLFEAARRDSAAFALTAVATRTGRRAEALRDRWSALGMPPFAAFAGAEAVDELLRTDVSAVCIATPDDRHFEPALKCLRAGRHVLIEKPSVLRLDQLDELERAAREGQVLCKVVYHKLLDPDHKRLRTLSQEGVLRHVNNGYCSLLEPKQISGSQFAEWIAGRNPATYVGVHYWKLIDFTFGPDWHLKRIAATGQRGIVGPADGATWDAVQVQIVYEHPDRREAAFDIHTGWVMPDNFPGYVEQEVQFRFDNAIWNAHQRKRGVELAIEGLSPGTFKNTPNHHYNARFLEPWGEPSQRGYGIETLRRFFHEVATVENGPSEARGERLAAANDLAYNDISTDRNCVAITQAVEAILLEQAAGRPGAIAEVNAAEGGLVLLPRRGEAIVLYSGRV